MVRAVRLRLLPSLAAAFGLICPAASVGDADDVARAREGVRTGRFVPLERVVGWVEARYHGRLLEADFEVEDEDDEEVPTYELEWMTPAGHVIEFQFDARDGNLLGIDGHGIEKARRQ